LQVIRDVYFRVVKNDTYWRKDANGNKLPYVDAIEVLFVVDPMTQKALNLGEAT
jgi:ABC-type transport system substrate-binding protein